MPWSLEFRTVKFSCRDSYLAIGPRGRLFLYLSVINFFHPFSIMFAVIFLPLPPGFSVNCLYSYQILFSVGQKTAGENYWIMKIICQITFPVIGEFWEIFRYKLGSGDIINTLY